FPEQHDYRIEKLADVDLRIAHLIDGARIEVQQIAKPEQGYIGVRDALVAQQLETERCAECAFEQGIQWPGRAESKQSRANRERRDRFGMRRDSDCLHIR